MRSLASFVVLSLATACGSVSNLPDAGGGDDVVTPDARTTGSITVTVVTDYGDVDSNGNQLPVGVPRQGAQVFFIEPDGTYFMVPSGGDGVARSPDVHAGTTALVVRPQAADRAAIQAFLDLAVGASLTAGPVEENTFPISSIGSMTVNAPVLGGMNYYTLHLSCWSSYGTTGAMFNVTLIDPCDRSGRTMAVVATDQTTGNMRGYSVITVDMNPGANVTMPAYLTPLNFVTNVSGAVAGVVNVNVSGRYGDGPTSYMPSFYANGTPSGGSAVLQSQAAPAGATLDLYVDFGSTPAVMRDRVIRHFTTPPTNAAVDASNMLPFVTPPMMDTATRTATWTETGTTNVADIAIARGSWQAGPVQVAFSIFGPHTGSSIAMPALPPEVAQLAGGAGTGYVYNFVLIDDTAAAGYADLVPTADADSRAVDYNIYGNGAAETWVSGGNTID